MAERQINFDPGQGDVLVRQVGFIIESWRQAALGNGNTPMLLKEFRRYCGETSEEVFEVYFAFLRMLGRDSRRRLRVGHPGCAGMTPDEIQVLSLLAAAQTGQWTLFDAHLCWLAPNGPRAGIAAAAMVLADRLAGAGIDISARLHIKRATPGAPAAGFSIVRQTH